VSVEGPGASARLDEYTTRIVREAITLNSVACGDSTCESIWSRDNHGQLSLEDSLGGDRQGIQLLLVVFP